MNHTVAKSILLTSLLLGSSNLTQAQTANPPKAQYEMDISTFFQFDCCLNNCLDVVWISHIAGILNHEFICYT